MSGTISGPPSRNTATEELAVPRSKPMERGSGGGCRSEEEEEEEEEAEAEATTRGRRCRRMLQCWVGAAARATTRDCSRAALLAATELGADTPLGERDAAEEAIASTKREEGAGLCSLDLFGGEKWRCRCRRNGKTLPQMQLSFLVSFPPCELAFSGSRVASSDCSCSLARTLRRTQRREYLLQGRS